MSFDFDLQGSAILIIHETPMDLGVLTGCLESAGFETMTAPDGRSGLIIAKRARPDLILLDVSVPDMDGFETCRRLKEDEKTATIPVIFMIASTETKDKVAGFEAGGADFVAKPFQIEEILVRVRTHITLHKMRERLKSQGVQLEREISERAKAEEELQKAHAELQNRMKEPADELKAANTKLREEIAERRQVEDALTHEKERLAVTLRSIGDGVITTDTRGRVLFINEIAETLTGWTQEQAIGRPLDEVFRIINEKTREVCTNPVEKVLETGGIVGLANHTLLIARDGAERTIADSGAPIRDGHGGVLGVVLVFRDVTELKKSEEERIRLAGAIEQVAEGVIITDLKWIIQYANPAFERLSGYDRSELIGRHTGIFKSTRHNEGFYGNVRDTLHGGDIWSGRVHNKRKDGALFEVEAMTSPVRGEEGDIINYISVYRDITHEMALERQLRQAQKMEAIGTLAGGIAHDFNNILSVIFGFAELSLVVAPEGAQVRRFVNEILKAAQRAKELVTQILAFSRQGEQEIKPVQIAHITKETLKFLRASLPASIEMRVRIDSQSMTLADPIQVHQVLMNLCTNAAHAMREQGGVLDVSLVDVDLDACSLPSTDVKAGPYLMLSVGDTGEGMDAEVLERIFDPYFTTKGPGEGTGLGLALVHGIVKSHGGTISVRSERGKGTTFQIYLPKHEMFAKDTPASNTDLPGHMTDLIQQVLSEKSSIKVD